MTAPSPTPWKNGMNQIRDAENRLIAWLGYGRRGVSRKVTAEEQAANARLIAAAPALLEAARKVEAISAEMNRGARQSAFGLRLYEAVKDAIAAAEDLGSADRGSENREPGVREVRS